MKMSVKEKKKKITGHRTYFLFFTDIIRKKLLESVIIFSRRFLVIIASISLRKRFSDYSKKNIFCS